MTQMLNRAPVIRPEGPGWSDSGLSPSTLAAEPLYLNSGGKRNSRGLSSRPALPGSNFRAS